MDFWIDKEELGIRHFAGPVASTDLFYDPGSRPRKPGTRGAP
jgi:uridine phosphorylase